MDLEPIECPVCGETVPLQSMFKFADIFHCLAVHWLRHHKQGGVVVTPSALRTAGRDGIRAHFALEALKQL